MTVWINKRTCWTLIDRKFRLISYLTKIMFFFLSKASIYVFISNKFVAVFLHGESVRWQRGHWNGRASDNSHSGLSSEAERPCYPLHRLYAKWWTNRMRGLFHVLMAAASQPGGFSWMMYWRRWKSLALYCGCFILSFTLIKPNFLKYNESARIRSRTINWAFDCCLSFEWARILFEGIFITLWSVWKN